MLARLASQDSYAALSDFSHNFDYGEFPLLPIEFQRELGASGAGFALASQFVALFADSPDMEFHYAARFTRTCGALLALGVAAHGAWPTKRTFRS